METTTSQVIEVPISKLRIDTALQVRVDGLDPEHVASLREALDDLPPPRCVQDGKDYVDGINAYIDQAELDPNKLPGEYPFLGIPLQH